jgi:hypothetical protein
MPRRDRILRPRRHTKVRGAQAVLLWRERGSVTSRDLPEDAVERTRQDVKNQPLLDLLLGDMRVSGSAKTSARPLSETDVDAVRAALARGRVVPAQVFPNMKEPSRPFQRAAGWGLVVGRDRSKRRGRKFAHYAPAPNLHILDTLRPPSRVVRGMALTLVSAVHYVHLDIVIVASIISVRRKTILAGLSCEDQTGHSLPLTLCVEPSSFVHPSSPDRSTEFFHPGSRLSLSTGREWTVLAAYSVPAHWAPQLAAGATMKRAFRPVSVQLCAVTGEGQRSLPSTAVRVVRSRYRGDHDERLEMETRRKWKEAFPQESWPGIHNALGLLNSAGSFPRLL